MYRHMSISAILSIINKVPKYLLNDHTEKSMSYVYTVLFFDILYLYVLYNAHVVCNSPLYCSKF